MIRPLATGLLCVLGLAVSAGAGQMFERDIIQTSEGDLAITFIGHGSLMFEFHGKVIHVDPFGRLADYSKLPKADLVLITHAHPDHLDLKALRSIMTGKTAVVYTEACSGRLEGGTVLRNGDVRTVMGLRIEAVAAYNLIHMRRGGVPFHPKGEGNGYIITFGDKRLYVAGDTENIPEMKALEDIDIAFLPMNLPYTMTPEMVADAAKAFKPRILYPYHYGDTDTSRIVELMKDEPRVEVRIRRMP